MHLHLLIFRILFLIIFHILISHHCAFALSIASQTEPTTYVEANKFTCWKKAMQFEIAALENNGTWKLVDLPPNVKRADGFIKSNIMQMDRLKGIRHSLLLKVIIKFKVWITLILIHQLLS